MPEFLELIDTIRAEEAEVSRLFDKNKDGEGVRPGRLRREKNPQYMKELAEAAKFIADIYTGRRPARQLQEAMTTSDFPYLFGDILDRQLLANYQEAPYSWASIVRRRTVRDFRSVDRYYVNGGEAVLDEVAEQTAYPAGSVSDGEYTYAVTKYGRRMPFSWEAMINDDLDALKDIPERLGKAARRTEEKFVTSLFVDSTGPHASYFTGANALSGNPILNTANLATGIEALLGMSDADSEPIAVAAMTLWVPPALFVTAQNIKNALTIEWTGEGGDSSTAKLVTGNWIAQNLRVEVGYYIPVVASSSNGSTSWFLFANPNEGRPAGELGFLRGHETPEVFIKAPNAARVGGGEDAFAGDFETDSIEYKVRHVLGGCRMDVKSAVASSGAGS